jgi:hypothetical protein
LPWRCNHNKAARNILGAGRIAFLSVRKVWSAGTFGAIEYFRHIITQTGMRGRKFHFFALCFISVRTFRCLQRRYCVRNSFSTLRAGLFKSSYHTQRIFIFFNLMRSKFGFQSVRICFVDGCGRYPQDETNRHQEQQWFLHFNAPRPGPSPSDHGITRTNHAPGWAGP